MKYEVVFTNKESKIIDNAGKTYTDGNFYIIENLHETESDYEFEKSSISSINPVTE